MSFRFDPDLDLKFSRPFNDTVMSERDFEAPIIERGKKQSSLNHFYQNQGRSIFVRDLPFHTTAEVLRDFIEKTLGQPGCVEDALIRFSHQGKTLQVACVLLYSEAIVVDALEKLHGARFCGRDIRVTLYNNKAPIEDSQNAAVQFSFLANETKIPLVTEEVVRSHMEEIYGPLRDVCIRFHRFSETGIQSGYGFLTFVKESDNERAVDEMQKKVIHDLQYDCRWSSKCKPVSAPGTLRNKRLVHLAASTPTYGTDALVALQQQSEISPTSNHSRVKSNEFSFMESSSQLPQTVAPKVHETNETVGFHTTHHSSANVALDIGYTKQHHSHYDHQQSSRSNPTAASHHSSLYTRTHSHHHHRAASPLSSHYSRPNHPESYHQQYPSQHLPAYPHRDFPSDPYPSSYRVPNRDYYPSPAYPPIDREDAYRYPPQHLAPHAPRYNVREDLPPSRDFYHTYDHPSPREYDPYLAEREHYLQRSFRHRQEVAGPYFDYEHSRDPRFYNHSPRENLDQNYPHYEREGEELLYGARSHLSVVSNGRHIQQAIPRGHKQMELTHDRHHLNTLTGVLSLKEQSQDGSMSTIGLGYPQHVQDRHMMHPGLNSSRFDINTTSSATASIPLPLSPSRQFTDDTATISLTSSVGSISHLSSSLTSQPNIGSHDINKSNKNTMISDSIPILFQNKSAYDFRSVGIGMNGNEEVTGSSLVSGASSLLTLGGASPPSLHSQLSCQTNSMAHKDEIDHLNDVWSSFNMNVTHLLAAVNSEPTKPDSNQHNGGADNEVSLH